MKKPFVVLSYFDGISVGSHALKEVMKNKKRDLIIIAVESDRQTRRIAKKNHREIIHHDDVNTFTKELFYELSGGLECDLIMGGSPCQDFSLAGKKMGMVGQGDIIIDSLDTYLKCKNGDYKLIGRSALFWEFVKIVKELKPRYFLLENVRMVKKWKDMISNALGVQPILINSAHFVPQNRERYYWTNIPNVKVPDWGFVNIQDLFPDAVTGVGYSGRFYGDYHENGDRRYITTKTLNKDNIIYCLTVRGWGGFSKNGKWSGKNHYLTVDGVIKTIGVTDGELLQGLPPDYTNAAKVALTTRKNALGNAWTSPVIQHIFKEMEF